MGDTLFGYERVNPTTWAYLSSLLTIALFFKFSRFWSVRNFDLLLVIFLAPGLLCIKYGLEQTSLGGEGFAVEMFGYIWLFAISGLLLVRMLVDPAMVRRPMLDPNLTVGGLSFLAVSLLLFLMANVLKGEPEQADLFAAQRAEHLRRVETSEVEKQMLETHGPGFTLLYLLPHLSTQTVLGNDPQRPDPQRPNPQRPNAPPPSASDRGAMDAPQRRAGQDERPADEQAADATPAPPPTGAVVTARVMAILSQMMIVLGIVLVAARHFDNAKMGIAAATLYLLLPYTAMWTGAVTAALPGALLVWAILFYRRPLISGVLIGALCGSIYYPIFLMPLWIAFYWNRGLARFLGGFAVSIGLMMVTLVFTSFTDTGFSADLFLTSLQKMFGLWLPRMDELPGVWRYWAPIYRMPVIAVYIFLSLSFLVWPAQKNLGTLLSCSAALMIGTQFWHAHSGGMALAWYLPVLLLTVFRPNLEDRFALEVVAPNPWRRRKAAA